jgi:tetratricopeptide (TPR) repeat protein
MIAFLLNSGQSDAAVAAVDQSLSSNAGDKALGAVKANITTLAQAASNPDLRPLILKYLTDPTTNTASLDALTTIATALKSQNPTERISTLRTLADRNPRDLSVQVFLVRSLIDAGRIGDAVPIAAQMLDTFSDSADAARVATEIFFAAGKFQEMYRAAQQWRAKGGEVINADVAIAQALIGLSRSDEASKTLRPRVEAAQADPTRYGAVLLTLADALRASGHVDQAADLVWPLAAKDHAWRTEWIRFAAQRLGAADGRQWLERVAPLNKKNELNDAATEAMAWSELADRTHDSTVMAHASDLYSQLEGRGDVSASVLVQAGMFRARNNQKNEAQKLYYRAIEKEVIALNNLAMLLAENGGNLKEAQKLAATAVEIQPKTAPFLDTLAFVQAADGNPGLAAQSERKAIDLEPQNAKWRIALAQHLVKAGQDADAARVVRDVDDIVPDASSLPESLRKQLESVRRRVAASASPATRVGETIH